MSPNDRAPDVLVSHYGSGDAVRSRSVSTIVRSGTVDVPTPPAWLAAHWARETATTLAPGDVDTLPLARTRMRWPAYRQAVQAAARWTGAIGLGDLLASCDVALMACRGARYHHDGALYAGAAFCNLFLSEDQAFDVHFPGTGDRIPLTRGTVLVFDTCQPHAVIRRSNSSQGGFDAADFAGTDCTQVFLTWELPIEDARVAQALKINFDVVPVIGPMIDEEQVRVNGAVATVCTASGRWCVAG
ncbi:hypothetical protein [Variovorax ginsengisoli]|uniref:Aspartyl/asparaginy/proline hydroxylase domain-containing protein n=1 Tax=Variovorax ginsengisoli TaxID=363844 RepID=A0ABT9SAR7_9BURK|nr:hypothetical protein [Variovorax ginsengisoli]MDP9901433.1 hypothetical protein [Variovorax ginsengisoli]